MCLCGVWSVGVCYHLLCKCSSLSYHVRTCSLSTNVVSDCDGTTNMFRILCKPWCGNVDIGLQSPKYDLQEALIYVLCRVDMFYFPHVLVCPSHHWFDRGQRRQRKTLCASTWCECSFVYVRVRQGVVCVLFFLSTVLRQISDCFKWARQFQSVEMYVIAKSRYCGWVEPVNFTLLACIDFCLCYSLGSFVLLLLDKRNLLLHVERSLVVR